MHKATIPLGPLSIRFLVDSDDSSGSLATFELTVPAGAKVPMPHYHERFDETIYGLEGVLTFTVAGKTFDLGPGDSCFIPRGAVHGFTNPWTADAKALAIITPALLGPAYFEELAVLIQAGSPPDPEKVKAVMTRHGLVPVLFPR